MIEPIEFVQRMHKRWIHKLGNVPNDALSISWATIARVFNERFQDSPAHQWEVLMPPTGTGKTQSAILYSAMLCEKYPGSLNPGVLIVTRRITDCDSIRDEINKEVGHDVAIARHSESRVEWQDVERFPVLVVTHRAYIDAVDPYATVADTLHHLYNRGEHGESRKLTIIDEAIDLVEHSHAELDGLRFTLGSIPSELKDQFPTEIRLIEDVINVMEWCRQKDKADNTSNREMMLDSELPDLQDSGADLPALIDTMRKADLNVKLDADPLAKLRKQHIERLMSLLAILKSWAYSSQKGLKHVLHTARLLVPEDGPGAVVMDATASPNLAYKLMPGCHLNETPDGCRNYQNVTLHVSRGHRVGKKHMEQNAHELCGQLVAELNASLKGRKVLIVTHKNIEPMLKIFHTEFEMHVGHWGAIDGSNDWKDCDAVVVFGLPYFPNTWTANVYMAYQGPQTSDWLQKPSEREYGEHRDIRQALKNGQIATSVIQAINRVRCRKVIDKDGNCDPTDVYLMLPVDTVLADKLMNTIKAHMPGIQISDWDYTGQRKKPRKSNLEAALISHLENMEAGTRMAVGHVGKVLHISRSSMDKFKRQGKDMLSNLGKAMKKSGIMLETVRQGKTQKTYFVKHP